MTASTCDCGYERHTVAGYELCVSHCDGPTCQSKCDQCRKYDLGLSRRINA